MYTDYEIANPKFDVQYSVVNFDYGSVKTTDKW